MLKSPPMTVTPLFFKWGYIDYSILTITSVSDFKGMCTLMNVMFWD